MRNLRLTLIAMALFGLFSCSKELPVDRPDGRYPILFGSSETRATADLDDLKADGFKVYAYFEGNIDGTTDDKATFEKDVTYDAANGVWGYTDLEYWIPGATYWFKAFYPAEPTSCTLTVDNTTSSQAYTIEDLDITKQEDVMAAANGGLNVPVGGEAPDTGNVVDLNFQHLLACVVIKIESEISGVTINNIIINNVHNLGDSNNGVWSSTNETRISIASGVSLEQNADAVDVTNGGILVLPLMSGHETITIEASNKTYSELSLPANTSWQAGNKYTYTAIIKQENIIFGEPEVAVWDSDNATGSVIIK